MHAVLEMRPQPAELHASVLTLSKEAFVRLRALLPIASELSEIGEDIELHEEAAKLRRVADRFERDYEGMAANKGSVDRLREFATRICEIAQCLDKLQERCNVVATRILENIAANGIGSCGGQLEADKP